MRTRSSIYLAIGLLLGLLLGGQPVVAQTVTRIFGTLSGSPIALTADSSGRLRVVCE